MGNLPASSERITAAETVGGVIGDLSELPVRILREEDLQPIRKMLSRLAEEITQAAASLARAQGQPQRPGPPRPKPPRPAVMPQPGGGPVRLVPPA